MRRGAMVGEKMVTHLEVRMVSLSWDVENIEQESDLQSNPPKGVAESERAYRHYQRDLAEVVRCIEDII